MHHHLTSPSNFQTKFLDFCYMVSHNTIQRTQTTAKYLNGMTHGSNEKKISLFTVVVSSRYLYYIWIWRRSGVVYVPTEFVCNKLFSIRAR